MNVRTTLTKVFLNYVFTRTIKICVKVTAQQLPEEKFWSENYFIFIKTWRLNKDTEKIASNESFCINIFRHTISPNSCDKLYKKIWCLMFAPVCRAPFEGL